MLTPTPRIYFPLNVDDLSLLDNIRARHGAEQIADQRERDFHNDRHVLLAYVDALLGLSREPLIVTTLADALTAIAIKDVAIARLRDMLAQIVHEYDQTYDASCEGGKWLGAAQIDVAVMERAKALVQS